MSFLVPFDPDRIPVREFDFLIVGSGVAGLSCAVELAPHGSVAVLTKESIENGSTNWAQGGIAAALGPANLDSPQFHLEDTLGAGAGLCDPSAVRVLVNEGPRRIRELIARGAHFDTEPSGELKLTREAAHRARRIVHAQGDSTGREVQRSLTELAHESSDIVILEDHLTVDFWIERGRCWGALALDNHGQLVLFRASATIVALLAFLSQGHTATNGVFRSHVARLVGFLKSLTGLSPNHQQLLAIVVSLNSAPPGDWLNLTKTSSDHWKEIARTIKP